MYQVYKKIFVCLHFEKTFFAAAQSGAQPVDLV